ncbi:MAG TPA: penicillin-binding protein 1C [Xanthobacteraceae bacterium]|jgi:penicillin-binding protein 1C|nr:penicillin-binding protein 1C [Xanthobacteraceae bacterium]
MKRLVLLTGIFVLAVLVAAGGWVASLGPPPLGKDIEFSRQVLDRNGKLLRAYATVDGRWRLPATVVEVDPRFFDVLFAYEDKRFRSHRGVDPLALTRAGLQLVESGRIRSGGSTLTMQVARLLEPRSARTFGAKLRQIVRAVEIEHALNKDQVLALYLDLAPYGGNIEGIRAASLAYFGREPRHLSLAEVALLVALPQSPEARRPDHSPMIAEAARDRVLDRFAETGLVPADEIAHAKLEPVPTARRAMPLLAPHAADEAIVQTPAAPTIRLSIDSDLQKTMEQLARERARTLAAALSPDISLAIVVLDNATGQVLARVGAPAYFDARHAGQVDMTTALRSPGSALKPFIYGMGFEDGFIHPETLVEDRPVSYGTYMPKDFDFGFKGTVSIREALQLSLNVPAVAVLDRVGPGRLAARLSQAGAILALPPNAAPGLAIGLGGVGIKLTDLTMLYAGIARLGAALPLDERADTAPQAERRLMEPVAAWYVGRVLLGSPPPENGVAGRVAFKTGTSYGYRDAWSAGFDGKHTIGVWVGRPDGAPVPGLVGRTAAAPILFDAFSRLGASTPLPKPPAGILTATNTHLPLPLRRFQPGRLAGETARPALHILFPPDGAQLDRSAGQSEPVPLKVSGAVAPLTVLVNGVPVANEGRGSLFFDPAGPGFSRVTVMDAAGASDSIVVRVMDGIASASAVTRSAH